MGNLETRKALRGRYDGRSGGKPGNAPRLEAFDKVGREEPQDGGEGARLCREQRRALSREIGRPCVAGFQ